MKRWARDDRYQIMREGLDGSKSVKLSISCFKSNVTWKEDVERQKLLLFKKKLQQQYINHLKLNFTFILTRIISDANKSFLL